MTAHDASDGLRHGKERGPYLTRGLALALVVFGFLPIANWIRGGHEAPWYGDIAQSWITGTAITVGLVVVLVILSRRRVITFVSTTAERAGSWFEQRPRQAAITIALIAALLYALTALLVFDGRALFIDEIVQLYQARLFRQGLIAEPVGPLPEFFGALNIVSVGDRQFGQFPPGGPAHLLIGVAVGAPWVIVPVFGGLAVLVFAFLVRHVEHESSVALGAVLLFAFSPFMLFMAASQMNHVPTLLWVLLVCLAWANLTSTREAGAGWALLFGFAAGAAATIRPLDALVMTAPAGITLLWQIVLRRQVRTFVMLCVGVAVPAVLLMAYNAATSGSPFVFGYEAGWGKAHSLGFHSSPWGAAHTPARGVELLNLYVLRLQSYLFETPTPSLLPVIVTLALVRQQTQFDRIMLWSVVLLAVGYFAYWHDGFYLGPRFFFAVLPVVALLAARAPRAIAEATGKPAARNYAVLAFAASLLIALLATVPQRARLYAQSLSNSRHRLAQPVDSLGIREALIFVRESWGSQVLARLWGRGVSPAEAEFLYRSIDTCQLDSALRRLEANGIAGEAAATQLRPLLADSATLRASTLSPDHTERMGNTPYSAQCLERVMHDRQGLALYPVVLAEDRRSNIYARDLGDRNVILMNRYPQRAAYVLRARSLGDSIYLVQPLAR